MPSFNKGGSAKTPFGNNEYLRSTQDVKKESYTVAASSVPVETIDGVSGQKILFPGTVMAKITSGSEAGKIGPFMGAGAAETQTLTKAGTVSGGSFTLAYGDDETTDIAWDADATAVTAALNALPSIGSGGVSVTGGPIGSTAFTVTFHLSGDQPLLVADTTNLTGASADITVAEGTAGTPGANDGRQTAANIVGLNDTFLPWQLMEHDNEVAVTYEATAVQGWCLEYDAAGERITLTNTTADAMRGGKSVNIHFK